MRRRISPKFCALVLTVVTAALVFGLIAGNLRLNRDAKALAAAKERRQTVLDAVAEAEASLAFAQTDDYVVRVARDELNMLMPGEVRYTTSR